MTQAAVRLDPGEDEPAELHDINVTPFIDVMLVLLIIFMVAAPLATVDVAVDLPSANARPQQSGRTSRSFSRSRPTAPAALPAALDAATGSNKQERILLRADRTVPYGEVMKVLNALRTA